MSTAVFNGGLGNALNDLLGADDIMPGSAPSYQLCKKIYAYHPLGAKIVEKPITLAQSKPRKIMVNDAPETIVADRFIQKWKEIGADAHIFNLMRLSRVYGIASLALLVEGKETNIPINARKLYREKFSFNVFDPLNTAGSLVVSQIPNDLYFLKTSGRIAVSGQVYHASRCVIMQNEDPLYIDYTTSAFGFTGRSVYQRALYPLKSFLSTMRTDNLVAVKAGTIVAKLKQPGSITDKAMGMLFGHKRQVIKEAQTDNVINIGPDDEITAIDLQNVDGAFGQARTHILENIAAAADDMPAILLNQETFAQGFGEGSEDAKMVGRYVDRIREKMQPVYTYFDNLVQYLAWTPEFYETVQATYSAEYGGIEFEDAFYQWSKSFTTEWPPFLDEPPSEQVKVDDVKLKAVIAMVQVLAPQLDPDNLALLLAWACDNFNEMKLLFGSTLQLDLEELAAWTAQKEDERQDLMENPPEAGKPFAAADSVDHALVQFSDAVQRLTASKRPHEWKTRKKR